VQAGHSIPGPVHGFDERAVADFGDPSAQAAHGDLQQVDVADVNPACRAAAARTGPIARHGKANVAVCGELAGDPPGALVLVGLGVDELSADAGSLDGVRAALAGATGAQLADLAKGALSATDAESVRAMARELLEPTRATPARSG
jgi:phosphoenolpyruvate-protein kinase (PTS system EI component)